jgi:hypothetical protein
MSSWSTELRRREIELAATRTIEILESFRSVNRRLADELLDCLGRLGPDELYQLFGDPSRKPGPAPATVKPPEPVEQPAAEPYKSYLDMTVPERMLADLKRARYDENGKRTNPGRSAFEEMARNSERPAPRSTHWSD